MARKKKREKINIRSSETKTFFGLLFFVLSIALILTPFVKNQAVIFVHISTLLGWPSVVWGIALLSISVPLLTQGKSFINTVQIVGFFIFAFSLNILLTFWIPIESLDEVATLQGSGGTLGKSIHTVVNNTVGDILELVIILVLVIVAFSFITKIEIKQIAQLIVDMFSNIKIKDLKSKIDDSLPDDSLVISGGDDIKVDTEEKEEEIKIKDGQSTIHEPITTMPVNRHTTVSTPVTKGEQDDPLSPSKPKYDKWKYPSIDMLQEPQKTEQEKEVYKNEARVIESVLKSFNIPAKVVEITIGPTVVRYALSIPAGVAVNKVKRQSNDIEVALRVTKGMMRIEAPIPGTSYIGIEIPNKSPNYVYMKEMAKKLLSEADKYELPIILGRDIAGKPEIKDLAILPHLLVAGMTRAGKSIGINSILGGLLLTKTPDELKLILVDPKIVEMEVYNGIPHLLTPVINDMTIVVNALRWAITEMMKRYRQLKQVLARNIVEYNKKIGYNAMPYLVIVIDEMADLMLVAAADVEKEIQRLAQMGRAVGIHLILATQKPVVTVITGLIKSNISGRIAYAVPSAMDSRVILDQTGAENLLGSGDMLYKDQSMSKPVRIQGCFISTEDTVDIIEQIKTQMKEEETDEEQLDITKEQSQGKSGDITSGQSREEEFPRAVEVVVSEGKASGSLLQRRLNIGYNKAARLIEQLEEAGVISEQDGVKARDVLISSPSEVLEDYEDLSKGI